MRWHRWFGIAILIGVGGLLVPTDSRGQRREGGDRKYGGSAVGSRSGNGGGHAAGVYGGGSTRNFHSSSGLGATQPSGSTTSGKGTYTTQRGGTVNYGSAGAKGTGAQGGKGAAGVYGIDATTAGGKSLQHVGHAGGVMGPGGYEGARRGGLSHATGERGSATTGSRGGIASGPAGNTVGGRSRGGVASNGRSTVAGGSRSAFAANSSNWGRYTSRWGVAGQGTHYVAGGSLHAQGAYVRGGYAHYNSFNTAWFRAHPTAWHPTNWTAATYWTPASYTTIAPVIGLPAQPITYDYGNTVVYEGGQVYNQGQPVGTTQQYAEQAANLALQGQQAKAADTTTWTPLGVFGLVQGQETDANTVFQLAINKDGILRGNYYDALAGTTLPVAGSVDKKTQRAAWIVDDRKDTVYETGFANLTRPEAPVLIHFGKDKTQQWTLIRLEKPEDEGTADKQK